MIRVLHIVTYMGRGGLETMIMNYYRNIDRNKVQFDFIVHRQFEAEYDAEILRLGGKIYRFPKLNPVSKAYIKCLDQFFKNHVEYKIVHCHLDCMSAIPLYFAKKYNISVRIAHAHASSQDKNIKYFLKKYFMRKIPKQANHLFACSKLAGEWMFQGNDFQVITNAIDVDNYRYILEKARKVKNQLNLDNQYVIGHVGRFSAPKNHTFLLEVFFECKKINSDIKLLLVGDGEKYNEIKHKITKLGLQNDVIVTGVRNDVHELLLAMDVFVFPSLYEGLGISIVEAQASGLPCIISDCIPDDCIVTENLVSKKSLDESPTEWANTIMRALDYQRRDTGNEVKKAGYSIKSAAAWLQNFYLNIE